MNKLPIEKDSRKVYDIEYQSKASLLLKGVGKQCEICGKHIFINTLGRPRTTCSDRCRHKKRNDRHRENIKLVGLHSFIVLKRHGVKKPYRVMKLYLKKGLVEEIKITPMSKQLWSLLNRIENFRDIQKPLEITT